METVMIYLTASNADEAHRIASSLVSERLAACVNIFGKMKSFYWWEGKIEAGEEVALIAKTRACLSDKVVERIKALHSYDCPCVVVLPISGGNSDFLQWIRHETGGE